MSTAGLVRNQAIAKAFRWARGRGFRKAFVVLKRLIAVDLVVTICDRIAVRGRGVLFTNDPSGKSVGTDQTPTMNLKHCFRPTFRYGLVFPAAWTKGVRCPSRPDQLSFTTIDL